jgi:hypothetical protein
MAAKIDLTGKKYNRLLVESFAGTRRTEGAGQSIRTWNCLCDCGNRIVVDGHALKCDNTMSCGCYKLEVTTTHGMWKDRFYGIWADMKVRCDCPTNQSYHRYGGRGIGYQDSWVDFEEFKSDMYPSYEDHLTLERVDVHGNYCIENCTWITKAEQARNKGMDDRNKTGVTGVRTWVDKKTLVKYYVADAQAPDGSRMSKHFSTVKYGEEGAFNMAVERRKEYITLLNEQGAGYGENHGTNKEAFL